LYNSTDGPAPVFRLDEENLALVHGQADPDFDAAEAFSTEVDNTRSAAILERDIQLLTDRSQEWNFFDEEEKAGKWGTRIRQFSFQQSSGVKDDQRTAAAKKPPEEKLTKNKAKKLKDENSTFSKSIVNKVETPKTDIAVGKKKAVNVNKDTDDLNYFDALTFKESYAAFSASESDRPREVIREKRQVLLATELTDLQEVDRQYLVGGDPPFIDNSMLLSHPSLSGASSSEAKLADVKREKLNFFDEQLFLATNDAGREESKPVSISSKPTDLAAKQSQMSEELTQRKEIKIVKKVARDVPKMSGSALDYVRKLRKTEGSGGAQPGGGADPVESVGVGIMARVAAATASLHTTIQVTEFQC
jgi:hypothetical protein